ncbi:hypothetical protein OPV22_009724 [Ensete ventricosum]|uniref:KIB1-4 beta-propeller domain-containing protein n=1 Tax=Ensete ventricosum TaxID=4639 RepID=A0AAV8RJQ7_ENSVE|nr:hypothetical protein OPV22_009724 [Ensete ventricosum]RWW18357.1 hypothetical protein GW17_00017670 [Ensete ventricosum]RZR92708.1 hypothetical protein BHM03_00021061 [Ensete ventricosum]
MADHVPRVAIWAGLRQHLLKLTSSFLRNASDYIRFRAVCKCWRSAVPPGPRHLPTQLPFLLCLSTPEPRNSSAFCLADAFNGSMRRLPHTTSMYCIGSSYGWLILISEATSAVSLFNPVTAEDIPLPRLSTLPSSVLLLFYQSSDGIGSYLIKTDNPDIPVQSNAIVNKAVLSSDPTLDRDFVAIVFLDGIHKRCFTCRPGDSSWNDNVNEPLNDLHWIFPGVPQAFNQLDVVPYGHRRLCAVYNNNDNLAVFDVDPGPPGRATMIAWNSMPPCVPRGGPSTHLIGTAGELLLVTEVYKRSATGINTWSFRVFRLDPGDGDRPAKAIEVEDIGDRILFLGTSHSVCVAAGDFPGFLGNAIYFVKEEKMSLEGEDTLVSTVSVVNLGNGEITEVIESGGAEPDGLEWLSDRLDVPWWVAPNLGSVSN